MNTTDILLLKIFFAFHADRAVANMVTIPKTGWAFCKKCGKDALYVQGKWCYNRKLSSYGGQTKPPKS